MITKYKDYEIYYEVHGQGMPLIILNGIMMNTGSWHQFLDELNDFKIILLDFIDQGKSSDGSIYTHKDQVELVNHLVGELGLKEVNMLGVSYGAQIAMQYAINYKVDKLMVCNAALYTTPWLRDIGNGWRLAAKAKEAELFYHVSIPYIYSHLFYNGNNDWMNDRKEKLLTVFDEKFMNRMIRLIDSSSTYDIRDRANKIESDVCVIGSEFDYLTPADETIEIAKNIENADWILIKECGHASMYEKPNAFTNAIKNHFLV